MKRFLSVVAATAAAAAVAAAITLPAGADAPATDQTDVTFVDCLRAHGVDIPAGARGDAIRAWLVAHDADPDVGRAAPVCKSKAAGDDSPPELVACLRDHGLTARAGVDELRPWIARQFGTAAGRAAVRACGIAEAPAGRKPAGAREKQAAVCGDPAPAAKPD